MNDAAKEFADKVYERIAHGDDEHRAWLRKECDRIAEDLRVLLVKENQSRVWTDIDMEVDPPN